ncbi:MAG: hypothetical protein K0Q65_281 [Clostridia bacterium]|nr:hypothetical protein [Clostridia bacterium]
MKLLNNKQLMFRVVAAVAEAILFYIGFVFANQMVNGSKISIAFFIIIALCGLFINLSPYNSIDKRKQSLFFGSIGLALAVLSIGISSLKGFQLFALPIGFIALIFLYYRSYTSYLSNVFYVYTVESFYQSVAFLFLINAAAAFWNRSFGMVSDELMRYSVLYLIMALYMLSEVKNFRYVSKNENSRKTAFDIAATSLMIIITIIMSIPKVFRIVTFPFVTVFQFVYGWIVKGILAVTYPIARLLNYFYSLIPELDQSGKTKPDFGNILGMPDKYDDALNLNSPLDEFIGKALAFIFMLSICAYAIYLLFKFINRITRSEEEDDFVENKEFILRSGKKKASGTRSKLAGAMKRAVGNLSFMLTADNGDKLRNEYRIFIQKLYSKKLIEENNCTAQDILQRMLIQIPNQRNELLSITETYEEVRYGVKSPGDDELKGFRKNIMEITKNLQQMQ